MTTPSFVRTGETTLYSPIGLRLVDDFTGRAPHDQVVAELDVRESSGRWQGLDREPVMTPSGVITYPGLGRTVDVASAPLLKYRVRVLSEFYRAAFLRMADGLEFDVHPYDDETPPAVITTHPQKVPLLPGFSYRFPGHVRVLRGQVVDVAGPVANVEISAGLNERVLSDERGLFGLPLRWSPLIGVVAVDAVDVRTGRTKSLDFNLPGDLARGHVITLS